MAAKAWYLVRALTNMRNEVDYVWPKRDRTSDGTIGDAAHASGSSDHNPDPDGSVDAWDMDVDGVDVWRVIDQFEKHESAEYWIYNRQIAFKSEGWRRKNYTGSNDHTKHVHFNVSEAKQDSNKPWGIASSMSTPTENAAGWVSYPLGSDSLGFENRPLGDWLKMAEKVKQMLEKQYGPQLTRIENELKAVKDMLSNLPAQSTEAIIDGVVDGVIAGLNPTERPIKGIVLMFEDGTQTEVSKSTLDELRKPV